VVLITGSTRTGLDLFPLIGWIVHFYLSPHALPLIARPAEELTQRSSCKGAVACVAAESSVISASAFEAFNAIAPGTFIEIYGSNLALDARGWSGGDFNGINAPVSLDGTSVNIGGQTAFVNYISPGQVNVLVPSNVEFGLYCLSRSVT